jgi:hypothetical protein
MQPHERHEAFVSDMADSGPLDDLIRKPDGTTYSEMFRQNWNEIERFTEASKYVARFNQLLLDALEKGSKRQPTEHQLIVQGDWALGTAHPTCNEWAKQMEELRQTFSSEPIFLVNSGTWGRLNSTTGGRSKFGFRRERSIDTVTAPRRGEYAGYVDLDGLERLFNIVNGLNPEDSFRLHGGAWHAALTQAALQLLALNTGKLWMHPETQLHDMQRVIIAAAAKMDSIKVRFGLTVDPHGYRSMIGRRHKTIPLSTYVANKFEDDQTRVVVWDVLEKGLEEEFGTDKKNQCGASRYGIN